MHKTSLFIFFKSHLPTMILKINLKTALINCGFKINLKPHLSITVLKLIFKTIVGEYSFKVNF